MKPEQDDVTSRQNVWKMFDLIAPRYDLLNRLLSLRQDVRWRKKMACYLPSTANLKLLDLACGTADQIIFLLQLTDRIQQAVGIDLAQEMLKIGQDKLVKTSFRERVELKIGDATRIPFADDTFDVVTITFGIRNVADVNLALKEMLRVLKPNGRVLILEFSLPKNRIIKTAYLFYFRHVLPFLGGIISGNMKAYTYLNKTVESFPYGQAFCDMIHSAGFENVAEHPITFGIATIYQGDKK